MLFYELVLMYNTINLDCKLNDKDINENGITGLATIFINEVETTLVVQTTLDDKQQWYIQPNAIVYDRKLGIDTKIDINNYIGHNI